MIKLEFKFNGKGRHSTLHCFYGDKCIYRQSISSYKQYIKDAKEHYWTLDPTYNGFLEIYGVSQYNLLSQVISNTLNRTITESDLKVYESEYVSLIEDFVYFIDLERDIFKSLKGKYDTN